MLDEAILLEDRRRRRANQIAQYKERGENPPSEELFAAAEEVSLIFDQIARLLQDPKVRAWGKTYDPTNWKLVQNIAEETYWQGRFAADMCGKDPEKVPNLKLPPQKSL